MKSSSISVLFGFGVLLFSPQPVLADDPVNVSEIKGCRSIKGNAERLLCYDTVADGGVFNEQQLEQVQRETFGSNETITDITVDKVSVTIVRIQKDTNGLRYFSTADGQVWKQRDRGGYGSEVPFDVELKTGALGSYFMVNEAGRSLRVKRVK